MNNDPSANQAPPEKMVRIIQSVPVRELEFNPQGEDFPEVFFYGDRVDVCDEDYDLVSDHYKEWLREWVR